MENKETLCAVVVTYNRKYLLLECLEALRKQTKPLDAIYLIDNFSADNTPELLKENGYINELPPENLNKPWEKEFAIVNLLDGNVIKLFYVRMNENAGGAGGFHEGVKRGYERGYDWLWLMDDDAEPKDDALEILEPFLKMKNIVALSNLIVGTDNKIQYGHHQWRYLCGTQKKLTEILSFNDLKIKDFIEINFSSFAGFLISKAAINKVGYPMKELFIHDDDFEYSLRVNKIGKIILVPKSIIYHKNNSSNGLNIVIKKFLSINYEIIPLTSFYYLIINYYGFRNLIYIKKKYCGVIQALIAGIKVTLKQIAGIILFDDNKFKRVHITLSALLDGLFGNFDNQKPKKILKMKD